MANLSTTDLERLVPDELGSGTTGRETLELHLARYHFASEQACGPRFLDLACGVGYGSHYLVERRSDLVGTAVDISASAIAYARTRYAHPRLSFVAQDAYDFMDADGFDTIISFETIEHLSRPREFVERMVKLLKPGGRFIASVPVTFSTDVNPHHLHDFSAGSFRALFDGLGLRELTSLMQVQQYRLGSVLRRKEARMAGLRKHLFSYYLRHPEAAFHRAATTMRTGFANHYLILVLQASFGDGC